MTNQFVNILINVGYTENNMPTNKSSLNPLLDLFYRVGNRSKDATIKSDIPSLFEKAMIENQELAVKIMGWSRSVRNGAGVREHLRSVMKGIKNELVDYSWFGREGYWKDIFYFPPTFYTNLDSVLLVIKQALAMEDNLILKYLPRAKKNKAHKNNQWVKVLREALHLTPAEYRKVCSSFVTPEAIICKKEWSLLDYSKIPSISMHRHMKTFYKYDEERIKQFIADVKSGKKDESGKVTKMNVATLYPHQIIMPFTSESAYHPMKVSQEIKDIAQAQWSQLPDKFKSSKKIFVVADTSGSMIGEPICISKALAIYMAERLTGAFHNFYAIFSQRPVFFKFKDDASIYDKVSAMVNVDSANTNLEALFSMVLHKAVTEHIPKEDMPEMIMIISDLQFDKATRNPDYTALEMIKNRYTEAGYEVPTLVFWNVRDSYGIPARASDKGVILFSGASPNCIQQAIEGEIDPISAMLRVVDKDEFYWLLR
ncbi:DUF2828 family protein [Immundisolibacter sp.]